MPMRPCWVEIRTRSLEENYRFLQTLAAPHAELLAIVKANAYGHSLELCAPAAVRAGAKWLGVTSVEEGLAARALCPEARILVIGGMFPGQGAAVVEHGLTTVVWERWQLDELESVARAAGAPAASLPIHLEIDTGMSRQGVSPDQVSAALARFVPESPLKLEGVMTHLFAADEADGAVTESQLAQMAEVLRRVEDTGLYAEWFNVGSSSALLAGQAGEIAALADRHGMKTMMRPGLVLYGLAPQFDPDFEWEPASLTAARARLQPVLSWKTRVTSLRSVPAGAVVGYNGTFVASEPMRLALLAVGYADGLDRRLGNRFSLLVRGTRAPLVGRISMDQAVIDVTDIPGVEAGDEVVILGTQGTETISAFDHAEATGTIPWEVFTRIGQRVRRVLV
ncbi:MAG: alanine racemase [Terracidiphilus sp.]|nr:alanine racemase [Terracidiphilus sp.]